MNKSERKKKTDSKPLTLLYVTGSCCVWLERRNTMPVLLWSQQRGHQGNPKCCFSKCCFIYLCLYFCILWFRPKISEFLFSIICGLGHMGCKDHSHVINLCVISGHVNSLFDKEGPYSKLCKPGYVYLSQATNEYYVNILFHQLFWRCQTQKILCYIGCMFVYIRTVIPSAVLWG